MAGSLPKESVGENQPEVLTLDIAGQNRRTYWVLLYIPNLIGEYIFCDALLSGWSMSYAEVQYDTENFMKWRIVVK